MTTSSAPTMSGTYRPIRQFGYTIAAVANGVMIWVAHNIVGWDVFGWLTADFDRLLPWLTVSFVIGIVLDLVYVWNDAVPVKSPGQILSSVVGLIVTIQTLRIFPFDFSGYGFDYAMALRIALWVAAAGIVFGAYTEASKLARYFESPSGS